MSKLVIENGANKGREVHLTRGTMITCGRESVLELPLPDVLASRRHFRIETRDGDFYLVDLDSSNGTFVNGRKVTEQRLQVGDRVQVGETLMSVLEDSERVDTGGLLGRVIGGYRLEKRIGRGGMGTVYKSTQLSLNRPVAMKILSDDLTQDRSFTTMFINEARSAASLSHPNIVLAYDVGKDQDKFFFAMEYVPGGSVQELLAKEKKLSVDQAVKFVIEAAKGLEYAEKRGIVHRDIKPDNLMITDDGGIKICDLGLAKRYGGAEESTGREGICGSPHYIAPEQAQGKPVDHRADIYSLGASFYRMLAGATPFTGGSIKELIGKHITEEPRPLKELRPDAPDSVVEVIERMMAREPDKRYQSAAEVINDLTSLRAFGYDLELEPSPEVPPLEMPDEGEGAEEPLLLEEEEPLQLEEAAARVAPPLPAPRPPPKPRRKFHWARTRRFAGIAAGVVTLLALTALLAYVMVLIFTPARPWLEDLRNASRTASDDMRAAVEICRKVQRDYPDDEKAQKEARKTLKDLRDNLIAEAEDEKSIEKYELLKELFPGDAEALAIANRGIKEAEKRSVLLRAEGDLRDALKEAVNFERRGRDDLLNKVNEMQARYRAVLARKEEKYKELSSPVIERILLQAREGAEQYDTLIAQLADRKEFERMLDAVRGSIKSKRYAQARTQYDAAEARFSELVSELTKVKALPVSRDTIETLAGDEYYFEIHPKVQNKLADAHYLPDKNTYDTFGEVHALLNDFLERYGEGRLRKRIESLKSQMEKLESTRKQVRQLVEQDKYEEVAVALRQLESVVTHDDLRHLVKEALTIKLDPGSREKVKAFKILRRNAEDLAAGLQPAEALKKIEEFAKAGNVIDDIRDDYEALREEARGLHDFLDAVARSASRAIPAGEVVLPGWNKRVESVDAQSIKLSGTSRKIQWSELTDESEALSYLFEYAAGNLTGDSEKLGAVTLCLKYGESLETLRLGYESLSYLATTLPSRYGKERGPYSVQMLEKVRALDKKLTEKYYSEGEPEEIKRELRDLAEFRRDIEKEIEKIREGES